MLYLASDQLKVLHEATCRRSSSRPVTFLGAASSSSDIDRPRVRPFFAPISASARNPHGMICENALERIDSELEPRHIRAAQRRLRHEGCFEGPRLTIRAHRARHSSMLPC
jgi:hypothetical protein